MTLIDQLSDLSSRMLAKINSQPNEVDLIYCSQASNRNFFVPK